MNRIKGPIFGVFATIATFWSFAVGDVPTFQRPELARIFFWHFPCSILAVILLCIGAYFSFRYLKTNDILWDTRSQAAHEIGYLFCLLTMVNGMMLSKAEWGDWWQNDPRQTSFLFVLVMYFAYFAIRASMPDPIRRATNAAGYTLACILPAIFLFFVFPRLPQIQTMHPNNTILSGLIDTPYRSVMYSLLIVFSVISANLYQLRVRTLNTLRQLEDSDGPMEDFRSDTPRAGVVRPVSLSNKD